MGVFLGLLSSITYGTVDFLGGLLSRRASAFAVALLSQAFGTLLLVPLVPLVGGDLTAGALAWGGAAGVGGGLGITLLYRGLAMGRMSVIAPVVAIVAASMPVAAGVALGERPGVVALAGVGLALLAVALIASAPHEGGVGATPRAAGLAEALLSGVLLGGYLVAISRAGDGTGLWPVAAGRVSSICAILLVAVVARRSIRPPADTVRMLLVVGVLDMAANVLFLLAVRRGLLSLIGVLSSLYPASTVLLARLVLKERLGRVQAAGLGMAAAGVVLIATG